LSQDYDQPSTRRTPAFCPMLSQGQAQRPVP
jgi:hypothetical protein